MFYKLCNWKGNYDIKALVSTRKASKLTYGSSFAKNLKIKVERNVIILQNYLAFKVDVGVLFKNSNSGGRGLRRTKTPAQSMIFRPNKEFINPTIVHNFRKNTIF